MDGLMIRLLFFLCCGAEIYDVVESYQCLPHRVYQCVLDKGYNLSTSVPIFAFEESRLRDFCAIDYHFMKSCLQSIAAQSTEMVQAQLQGCQDSLSYICEEDLEDYIEVKECVNSAESQAEIGICTHQYRRESEFFDDCQNFEEFIDCEGDTVTVLCGEEAGTWARTYNTRLYGPSIDLLDCDEEGTTKISENSQGLPVWLIIVIAVGAVLFLAVLVLIVFCVCRQATNENGQHNQNTSGHQATNVWGQQDVRVSQNGYPPATTQQVHVNQGSDLMMTDLKNGWHFHTNEDVVTTEKPRFQDTEARETSQTVWTRSTNNNQHRKVSSPKKNKGTSSTPSTHPSNLPQEYLTPTPSLHPGSGSLASRDGSWEGWGGIGHNPTSAPPSYHTHPPSEQGATHPSTNRSYPNDGDYTQLQPQH